MHEPVFVVLDCLRPASNSASSCGGWSREMPDALRLRSEIIRSELDLDNTSERIMLPPSPPSPSGSISRGTMKVLLLDHLTSSSLPP